MKYYVYNSRCQPLNNLIQAEIKWLADNIEPDDKIIIGIVNPYPENIDPGDNADTTTRFDIKYNPLSYWERHEMIASFLEKSGLFQKVAAIVPMPRPSTNMSAASNYLPERDMRWMCLSRAQQSETEDNKRRGMERQGEQVKEIPSYTFPDSLDIISPELIFCLMRIGNPRWTDLVSADVANYLEDHDVSDRVSGNMKQRDAKEDLSKIYLRALKADDKEKIGKLLQGYGIRGVPQMSSSFSKKTSKGTTQELQNLYSDIESLRQSIVDALPEKDDAPDTYKYFSIAINELSAYQSEISSDNVNAKRMQEIRHSYNKVKQAWQKEKN